MKRWHLIALASALGLVVWYRLRRKAGAAPEETPADSSLAIGPASLAGTSGAGLSLAIPDPVTTTATTTAPAPVPAPTETQTPPSSGPSSVDKLKERLAAQKLALLEKQAAAKLARQQAAEEQRQKQAAARAERLAKWKENHAGIFRA